MTARELPKAASANNSVRHEEDYMRTTGSLQSLSFAVPTVVIPDARQNAGGRRRRDT